MHRQREAVAAAGHRRNRRSAQELEALLRRNRPPIIARVERGWLLLDLRTVLEEQDEEIAGAFERLENTEA